VLKILGSPDQSKVNARAQRDWGQEGRLGQVLDPGVSSGQRGRETVLTGQVDRCGVADASTSIVAGGESLTTPSRAKDGKEKL
jgi:hypothetical protein